MKRTRRLATYWIFSALSILLLFFFWYDIHSLQHPRPITPLDLSIPEFHLIDLFHPDTFFTPKDFQGQVVLLNIWASWCYLCQVEHPVLLNIARQFHVPIYSFNYRDGSDAAKTWLNKNGNPYKKIGMDSSGATSMSFGVHGTPTTFLIDKSGRIRYQHIGVLTAAEWNNVLWPLVQEYEKNIIIKK